MGLPSQKRTKSSKKRRASHFALTAKNLASCPKCGKKTMPHHACPSCGSYKGKDVLTIKSKVKTAKQKSQERREQAREKTEKKEQKKAKKTVKTEA